jgi:drug/metabolite transporter (DMT)-like permease
MTRGALVLWVGLFSVIFLRRRLSASQWASLLLVMLGVMIVGLSGALRDRGITPEDGTEAGQVVLGQFVSGTELLDKFADLVT